MPEPTASPAVSSTVGLKNVVIAPLTTDTEALLAYGTLQLPRKMPILRCNTTMTSRATSYTPTPTSS